VSEVVEELEAAALPPPLSSLRLVVLVVVVVVVVSMAVVVIIVNTRHQLHYRIGAASTRRPWCYVTGDEAAAFRPGWLSF